MPPEGPGACDSRKDFEQERIMNPGLKRSRVARVLLGAMIPLLSTSLFAEGPPAGMVYVPGGTFEMGYAAGHEDEAPVHRVELSPFYIDRTEVTNAQFSAFVEATEYVTGAERDGFAWGYLKGEDDFRRIEGAQWRFPEGPGSGIGDRMNHPVVCVNWHDARAYAQWAGKRLPTEAEWEYAARAAGREHQAAQLTEGETAHHGHAVSRPAPEPTAHHASGSLPAFTEDGNILLVRANYWQGTWPSENRKTDAYFYTAPAGSYAPNDLGLHDMIGNAWEWCADFYASDYYGRSPAADPKGPETGQNRVARGGSWFCSSNYCGAYSTHYRGASPPDHAFNNVGFRCAVSAASTAGPSAGGK